MNRNWIKMRHQKPEQGQRVFYYFKHTGIGAGIYEERDFPDAFIKSHPVLSGLKMDCFRGERGFLCDDVTHWMPRNVYEEFPGEPDDAYTWKECQQMIEHYINAYLSASNGYGHKELLCHDYIVCVKYIFHLDCLKEMNQ